MAIATTCRVAANDYALLQLTTAAANETDRPIRPLHLQALLQLPRLANERGEVPVQLANALLAELAWELPPQPAWAVPGAGLCPRLLRFHEVPVSEVLDAMSRFHYLRSARMDGRAYSLKTATGNLVAFCVSSPLDVVHLGALLAAHGRPIGPDARVVSRIFAFDQAPRNSLSYLLARACQAERHQGVTDVVTYVNPNMGYAGSSYRASAWRLLGNEPGTMYRYVDGRYTTDRALSAAFGRHSDGRYRELLGERFAVNIMSLAPLLIFHRQLAEVGRSSAAGVGREPVQGASIAQGE